MYGVAVGDFGGFGQRGRGFAASEEAGHGRNRPPTGAEAMIHIESYGET